MCEGSRCDSPARKNDIGRKPGPQPRCDQITPSRRAAAPIILQFYAFGCLGGNLGVPQPFSSNFERDAMLGKFLRDEGGATAIEYSLIAGFIALAIIAAVGMTGERLVELFASLIPALAG